VVKKGIVERERVWQKLCEKLEAILVELEVVRNYCKCKPNANPF